MRKYYNELDSVRAVAALMVMFLHFFQQQHGPSSTIVTYLAKFAILGQSGVTLFFVLSGFLITRILLASKDGSNYFSSFYIRRSLRIFPLYYFFLALIFFIIPAFSGTGYVPFNKQVYNWVYLQNFAVTFKWPYEGPAHFWSLAVEEHFYLFWPLLVYVLDKRKLWWACISIAIIAIISRIVLLQNGYDAFWFTLTNMDSLAMGSILALMEPIITGKETAAKSKRLFTLCFFLVLIPTGALWFNVSGKREMYVQVIKPLLLNVICFSLIGRVIASESGRLLTAFKNKTLMYLGKISYGLYVYHPLCFSIFFAHTYTGSVLLDFVICFIIAIAVATASYYLFEARFLNLKKYFTYKKPGNVAAEPVPVLQPAGTAKE